MSSPQKERAQDSLRGLENVLLPSFDPDMTALDERGISWDVRASIAHGFRSTMLAMESGITIEECKRIMDVAVGAAGDEIHVSIMLLRDTIAENIELLRYAEGAGVDHATIGYPSTFRPRDAEDYFAATAAMCEASSLGIVLYASERFDLRSLHPSSLPFAALDRLVELPNVVGMKVGFPDPGVIFECFRRYGDVIQVNIGTAGMLGMFPMLHKAFRVQWGGAGMWEAWQSPEKPYMVEYFDLVGRGRYAEAMALFWSLSEAQARTVQMLGSKHVQGGADIGFQSHTLSKYLMWTVGGNGGMTRRPAAPISLDQRRSRAAALRSIGIEPREPFAEFLVGRVNYGA